MSVTKWMGDKALQKKVIEDAFRIVDDNLDSFMQLTTVDTTDLKGVAAIKTHVRGLIQGLAAVVGNCAIDWPSLYADKTVKLVGVKTLGTSADICWEDYELLTTKGQLQAKMTQDLAEALEAHLNTARNIFFNGIPEYAMDGLATSPSVLVTQVAQSIVNAPSRLWSDKTTEEIIADHIGGIETLRTSSDSRTKPDVYGVSQSRWTDLSARLAVDGSTQTIASVITNILNTNGINKIVPLDDLDSIAHPGGPGPVFTLGNSKTNSFGWNPTYLLGTDIRTTRNVSYFPSRVRGFFVVDPFTYGIFYDI